VQGVDPEKLRRLVLARNGAMFDGSALDRSTDALAVEMAKLGYPSRMPNRALSKTQTHEASMSPS